MVNAKDCARAAIELGDGVEKLNLGGFGSAIIDAKVDKFAGMCGASPDDVRLIKREIEDIVEFALERDIVPGIIKTTQLHIFGTALSKING